MLGGDGSDGSDELQGNAGDDLFESATLEAGIPIEFVTGFAGAGNDLGDGWSGTLGTLPRPVRHYSGNVLLFGPGITLDMIHLELGSLLLRIGDGGDAIHRLRPGPSLREPGDRSPGV